MRRQQADSGDYGLDETETLPEIKKHKFIENIYVGEKIEGSSHYSILLLQYNETHKSELLLYVWSANADSGNLVMKNAEQTIFILEGSGSVFLNDEKSELKAGEVVFVPRNSTYSIKSSDEQLICLVLNVNLV
ncbi:MAG: AraC family ligand binding domain-containing protein [Melioribacteraceae bacterium]|nr:AraC family ligand binding domain-containing protein [Melioribacteraceae bacterium]